MSQDALTDRLLAVLDEINVESRDNGQTFISNDRRLAIDAFLALSEYETLYEGKLCTLKAKSGYKDLGGLILISCHIDSLYATHFHREWDREHLIGTFDNAICNALLLELMSRGRLPASVMIAFTGDEEGDSGGATETMDYFSGHEKLLEKLEMVITLDVTAEGFKRKNLTVENTFTEKNTGPATRLTFKSGDEMASYLQDKCQGKNALFLSSGQGDPDESWTYDEFDLNCFSLCLPCAPHPEEKKTDVATWMHSDRGILVKKQSINRYSEVLEHLCKEMDRDLNG